MDKDGQIARERPVGWGEDAPIFSGRTSQNPKFAFGSLGGNFVALAFIGDSTRPLAQAFMSAMHEMGGGDLPRRLRFAVSCSAADLTAPDMLRAFGRDRVFFDPGAEIARQWGVATALSEGKTRYEPTWFILDPGLRVMRSGQLRDIAGFLDAFRSLPLVESHAGDAALPLWAPVLLIPRVLPTRLCEALIDAYKRGTPGRSGVMRSEDGRTIGVFDENFKRRRDYVIAEPRLRAALASRIELSIFPQIRKAFQFTATNVERFIVACYDSEEQGFFRPHRDDNSAGTAHRKFAVTINLNAEEHDGGELRFPEFGDRLYKVPTGAALVFSCSLLHEAKPVTKGVRYATLPFLFDEEGARIFAKNRHLIRSAVAESTVDRGADGDTTAMSVERLDAQLQSDFR